MTGNVFIGSGIMAVCVVIQCIVVAIALKVLGNLMHRRPFNPTVPRSAGVLITAMLIMFAGHMFQIAIWARVFVSLGEFDEFRKAFYHSAVNFSSLGYGDIVMSEKRRLLGAIEAGGGVLMFGLTTSLLFSVINQLVVRKKEIDESSHSQGAPTDQ